MTEEIAAAPQGTPEEIILNLAKQVETLKNEKLELESKLDETKKRAETRYCERQHALAETRRIKATNNTLQDREVAYENLFIRYQDEIKGLQDELDKARSLKSEEKIRQEMREEVRKEVEEEQEKTLIQEREKTNQAAVAYVNTKLKDHEKELESAKHAAKNAEGVSQAAVNEIRRQKQEIERKNGEVSQLNQRVSQLNQRVSQLNQEISQLKQRNEEISQLTQRKDQEIAYLKEIHGKSDIIEKCQNPPIQRYTPERKSPSKNGAGVRNGASPSNMSPRRNGSIMLGQKNGFDSSISKGGQPTGNPFESLSSLTHFHAMEIPQNGTLMGPRMIPPQSNAESQPQIPRRSASAMSSNSFHNAMTQPGAMPSTPIPRTQSMAPQTNQQFSTGIDAGNNHYGPMNTFQGTKDRPTAFPDSSPALSRSATGRSTPSRSTPNQHHASTAYNLNRQTNGRTSASMNQGLRNTVSTPEMHRMPLPQGNMSPMQMSQVIYSPTMQQPSSTHNKNSLPVHASRGCQSNGLTAQVNNVSVPHIESGDNPKTTQPTASTNNQIRATQAAPTNQTAHANGQPNFAEDSTLQLLPQPFGATQAQEDQMKRLLDQHVPLGLHTMVKYFLDRLQPANGDLHTVQQIRSAFARTRSIMEPEKNKPMQKQAAQIEGHIPRTHPVADALARTRDGRVHAGMTLNTPTSLNAHQVQPYGFQKYPTDHPSQPVPGTRQNSRASATPAPSGSGPYTGIACTACHEIWANSWCDDGEPCENCTDRGTACQRPSCENSNDLRKDCKKTSRCNRAHVDSNPNWTLAPWRKDLKRKGKQSDDRPKPAKRLRLEGNGNV